MDLKPSATNLCFTRNEYKPFSKQFKWSKNRTIRFALLIIFMLITSLKLIGQNKTVVIDNNYKCSCDIDSVDGLPVFNFVVKMPVFIGGDEARLKFLVDNTYFPSYEETEEIQYSIYTCFIIDTCGYATNICIYRPKYSDHFTEQEKNLMKIIGKMPKWEPGEQNGVKVPVRLNMPVKLDINEK